MAPEELRRLVLGADGDRPALVYAPGGGYGHRTRALALAARLETSVTVWHQAPGPPPPTGERVTTFTIPAAWTPDEARAALARAAAGRAAARSAVSGTVLVVDTFPGGLAGELGDEVLARFARRVLVARHVRPGSIPDHAALAARFDVVVLPYPRESCEWEGAIAGHHAGHLLRELAIDDDGPEAPLAVLGDTRRLPPAWRAALPAETVPIDSWVERLPRARRYLSVGAGYNASYELARAGVAHALVPLERRYDDQFRRADRLGRAIHTRADLEALLELEAS